MNRMIGFGLALFSVTAILGTPAAGSSALDVSVERYRDARVAATVSVRAYEEGRRSSAADMPLAGTTVLLVPRSERLLSRLAGIKTAARDSLARYRGAAAELRRAQDEFIKALEEGGGQPLVRRAAVDAAGAVTVTEIPAGDWVLIAWRAVMVDKRSSDLSLRDQRLYTLSKPMSGFRRVSVWMRELTLEPGRGETVELTDRNVWFSGIEEVVRTGPAR